MSPSPFQALKTQITERCEELIVEVKAAVEDLNLQVHVHKEPKPHFSGLSFRTMAHQLSKTKFLTVF